MIQFLEYLTGALSFIGWMSICFLGIAIPASIIALIVHLLCFSQQHKLDDTKSATAKIADKIVLILFPPIVAYKHGIKKALITLLIQFVGFIVTFAVFILIHKLFQINMGINECWGIIFLIVISWGIGILYVRMLRK